MNKKVLSCVIVAVAALCVVGCGNRSNNRTSSQTKATQAETATTFIPALPPAMIPEDQRMAYMVDHYWDKFDFSDTTFISKVDLQHMATAYAVYVGGYLADSMAYEPMSRLMRKASTSRRMFDYFMTLADMVLHDPNSPLRSDEKYIPVLEAAIASPFYDEYERMPYQHDLFVAMQNRIGRVANDFTYTLASGRSAQMSSIKAEYLLIFMSNPGCEMCREVREQIMASPMLNELVERGTLKILVLYPDSDLQAWQAHYNDYPSSWINAYDKEMTITHERLYDLKAIPALYLLDSEKRVMAKDCVDVEQIEHLIMQAEEQ
ncbi:MAG: DUF5106 domain-containing protein [Alistipes sp.]|nr:DUF5106 domain-containing protein [Alistipes sp.]